MSTVCDLPVVRIPYIYTRRISTFRPFTTPFVCHLASTLNRITQINCDARISADLFRDDGIVSYVYGNFVNVRLRESRGRPFGQEGLFAGR